MPTPGGRKATKASAKPKAPKTRKIPKTSVFHPDANLDAPASSFRSAASRRAPRKAAAPRRGSGIVEPSSEQMMHNEANRQSRAVTSARQVGGHQVGAPAGGGSRPKISMTRATPKAKPQKAGGGSPLTRGSNGSVSLRGGSSRVWKRNMLGQFSG